MTIKRQPATAAVRGGVETDRQQGAVIPPLYLSSNYTFAGLGQKRRYDYTRSGNPTRDLLADTLAELEMGAGAVVTSTGMAAINLCLQLLQPDDLLLSCNDCYGGTHRLLTGLARKGHFRLQFADLTQGDALDELLSQRPTMVWIETPSNPLLRICDISRICQMAKRYGSIVAVDNTFLSPALQKPLDLGADLVVHSTTKYINGHSDVVGGAVIAATASLHEQLKWWANCLGITGAPFDSFLTLRGLRTLHARMRLHCNNAFEIAHGLRSHGLVRKVYYPGFSDHPGHAIASRQQHDFGGMLSFELDTDLDGLAGFVAELTCFSLAESLGGVESLIAHPATMTHASMDQQTRLSAGIGDGLLRLSVGIEDSRDLLADLENALGALQKRSLRGVTYAPA